MLFDDWQFVADSVWPKDMVVATTANSSDIIDHTAVGRNRRSEWLHFYALCRSSLPETSQSWRIRYPKQLPLDPRAETTVTDRFSDRFSALTDRYGVRYGVNPPQRIEDIVHETRPDATTLNSWQVAGARDEMPIGVPYNSRLLGKSIVINRRDADTVEVAAARQNIAGD